MTRAMGAAAGNHEFFGHLREFEKRICHDLLVWEARSAIAAEGRADEIMQKLRGLCRRVRGKARHG